uniref:Uncharacterized protein n=1 Tax=Angiostrongylus cantonensis TaxID=6313 RepID=A0A0K0DKA2_ANGCA
MADSLCETTSEDRLVVERYFLLGVFGSGLAVFGLFANGLLTVLFLTRANYSCYLFVRRDYLRPNFENLQFGLQLAIKHCIGLNPNQKFACYLRKFAR